MGRRGLDMLKSAVFIVVKQYVTSFVCGFAVKFASQSVLKAGFA